MSMIRPWSVGVVAILSLVGLAHSQMPDPPGQLEPGEPARHQAYLFAHMRHNDYGRLCYSISIDGLHWNMLNGGDPVFDDYRGHPDICRGHDGRFYLVGNRNDKAAEIRLWVSDDLIRWRKHAEYRPDLTRIPDYPNAMARIGAPKLYFDAPTSQYLITWHTTHDLGETDLPEPYWAGQRTVYSTSKDLRTFSDPPRKLFDWDMATIDTIVRRIGDRYYAVIKDERYPTLDWPTGKTIRVCEAEHLLGPYSRPGPPVSPNFREAPTLIPSPDGTVWYLYYEQYPGVAYGLSVAERMPGPWHQIAGNMHHRDWDKYHVPAEARHGSMLPISRQQHDALAAEFGAIEKRSNDDAAKRIEPRNQVDQ
jgi:hypothetical protein